MVHTLETRYEIWDDKLGTKLTIGPDYDCLDLIEIRRYDEKDEMDLTLVLTKEQAKILHIALGKMNLSEKQNENN